MLLPRVAACGAALALLLTAVCVLVLALPLAQTWPLIYTLRERSGYWSVVRADVDRRVTLTLASGLLINNQPLLSPDARFVLWLNTADQMTYLYDRQTDTRRALSIRILGAVSWSPDSRTLAFVDPAGSLRLISIDERGQPGPPRTLAQVSEVRFMAAGPWSPDGEALVVFIDPGADLALITPTNGLFVRLTATPERDEYDPVWSPDGAWLLYGQWNGVFSDLRAARRDNTEDRLIVSNTGVTAMLPSWSPDGARILIRTEPTQGRPELSVIAFREDARPRLVTPLSPDNTALVWSPDGRRAAFTHAADQDLYWTYVPEVALGVPLPAFRLTDNNGINVLLR